VVHWAEKSLIEEKWNSITHAIGFGYFFSFLFRSNTQPESVYCYGALLVYGFSTLYHATERTKLKSFLRMMDMAAIHVLIAVSSISYISQFGCETYTTLPLCLGIVGVIHIIGKYEERGFVPVYVSFAALGFAAFYFSVGLGSSLAVCYFSVGITIYLLGLVFYLRDYKKWYHTMWHLFVLAGSIVHLGGLNTI
tara:strand:+ start:64 stop:645 length:582 start_codon:yes stop_codon:yes gene_type:complete